MSDEFPEAILDADDDAVVVLRNTITGEVRRIKLAEFRRMLEDGEFCEVPEAPPTKH